MLRNSIFLSSCNETLKSKSIFLSSLNHENFRFFRPSWLANFLISQSISTSSSLSSGKEKEAVESNIKPIKMAYTSYEMVKESEDNGYPVIIMHGLLGSKSNWNSLSKAIHNKTKMKVIAVDARNHGESPHTAEMSYHHIVADLKALMSDLSLPKARLIGHSMGGRSMMLLAQKYPELVKQLIIVDISPLRSSPDLNNLVKCFDAMKLVKIEPKTALSNARKVADNQLARYINDPGLRQFLLTNLVEGENGNYKWRLNLDSIVSNFMTNIYNFPNDQGTYEGPTFFIGGGNSDYLLKDEEADIKKIFPNAVFAYIPDAGHWVHAEKPEEFISLVTNFILNSDNSLGFPDIPSSSPPLSTLRHS